MKHKTALLVHLLQQPDVQKSVIFVRKRERVHELAAWLREAGINTCYLEGEMVQAKRNEAVKRMMDGRVNVLVATDVAARGPGYPRYHPRVQLRYAAHRRYLSAPHWPYWPCRA
ncbi:ATP-dependent RNA helicase SrmB [Serratia fonticola]|uniref:ATP-dependent RNA helicase SrmB n=1 Tax=Serratia fonticola TaxID=47917 RepID=A0A4U9UDE6_SERFO|nr:ATP-dependent RNA helicase SrmB [Serratia fonticola]